MTLKFAPGNHAYFCDGKRIPGVTTLISKGLPKPAIPYWAAKTVAEYVLDHPEGVEALRTMGRSSAVAALKQVPWTRRDEAAVRGTDVHALAERIIHGEQVDVPEHLVGHVEGYTRFIDTFGVEPILTEVPVANRAHWYAGKPDAIVNMGGTVWLLDWKTSSGVYGETALQTAAYARAEFYVNDGEWAFEHPMPQVERIGVVHVTADGSQLYDLGDVDEAFKVFTHVAWVANKTDWIKGLIGEPMTIEEEVA